MRVFDTHKEVAAALSGMISSGKIPHAMMFHEDDGGGAFPLIVNFLTELYGGSGRVEKLIHPDIRFILPLAGGDKEVTETYMDRFRALATASPCFTEQQLGDALGFEKKQTMIHAGEARMLLEKLSLAAVEGGYRSVVIYLPEKMNQTAANVLLKMVEEPPAGTVFLLITHKRENVLQTIASRCLTMRLLPLTPEEHVEAHPEENAALEAEKEIFADLMDALLRRDLSATLDSVEVICALSSREKQKSFCIFATSALRRIFFLQQGLPSLAGIPPGEEEWYGNASSRCRKQFPRMAMAHFDRAVRLLERNVSQRILFTDLIDKLYLSV